MRLRWRKGKARRSKLTPEKVMHFDGSWFIPCLVNAIRRETSDLHGGASWCIVLHYRTRLIEPINVSLTVQLQQSHPRELARLGWLPRQAKLPLHGGWYRTGTVCHWPWNVKSTIRKAELPQHKPGSPWKNWYNLCLTMAAEGWPKVVILVQLYLL